MSNSRSKMQLTTYSAQSRHFLTAAILCSAIALAVFGFRQAEIVQAEQAPAVDAGLASQSDLSLGFANLVEAVSPAVVSINTRIQRVSEANPQNRGQDRWNFRGQPFQDFWNGPFSEWFKQIPESHRFQFPERRPQAGLGSGVIFDPRGYVATNAHVVSGADRIIVTMADGTTHDASVIGIDEFTDLAVIKIEDAEIFPYARFGDSDEVRVGDLAIALGNPFGFQHSVSLGIVSAKHRDNVMSQSNVPLIQTDAAINRGNSGGPLFSIRGEIIGINTLIYSPSGASSGVGFAIPARLVQEIADGLISDGSIQRGRLGVMIQNLTEEIADAFELESTDGALVASIDENSAAANAGVLVGDVIVSFNGAAVSDIKQLSQEVRATKPGSQVVITVYRDGKLVELSTKLGQIGSNQIASVQDITTPNATEQPKIGVQLAMLSNERRQQYGIDAQVEGVVVVAVEPGSAAEEAGIQPGDVIVGASRQAVTTPDQVMQALSDAAQKDSDNILFLIKRDGGQRFLTVALS